MQTGARALGVWAALLFLGPAASAVTMPWTGSAAVGNPCDPQSEGCFGAVGYGYQIGIYEVTNAQYAEFLNAKAASDPLGLYNTSMGSGTGGIARSGVSGSFSYTAIAGRGNMPVNFVSFYDALRFANWLHNGQGVSGGTETGAYTLLGSTATPTNGATVTRNTGPGVFLTSEHEWYKSAYAQGNGGGSYSDWPTGPTQTVCWPVPTSSPNRANCDSFDLTSVGSYTSSGSWFATYDQGGNVFEWNEAVVNGSERGIRGGSFAQNVFELAAFSRNSFDPTAEVSFVGFRVVNLPEPGTNLSLTLALAGLLVWRATARD